MKDRHPDRHGQTWAVSPDWWDRLKPLARQMRREPTPAERRLWAALRRQQRSGFRFRRQHAIERFIVDFYCPAAHLAVEVDGAVHDYAGDQDAIRQELLESLGLRVLRFANDDVMQNIEGVITVIERALAGESEAD